MQSSWSRVLEGHWLKLEELLYNLTFAECILAHRVSWREGESNCLGGLKGCRQWTLLMIITLALYAWVDKWLQSTSAVSPLALSIFTLDSHDSPKLALPYWHLLCVYTCISGICSMFCLFSFCSPFVLSACNLSSFACVLSLPVYVCVYVWVYLSSYAHVTGRILLSLQLDTSSSC